MQHGLDGADLAVFDLEDLGDLPGPRDSGTGDHFASIGERAVSCVAGRVIKERKRECEATLRIDGYNRRSRMRVT